MEIKQFEDKNLSHYSYAVLSECEKKIVLIDPARNTQQYLDYAKEKLDEIILINEPQSSFQVTLWGQNSVKPWELPVILLVSMSVMK